MPKQTTKSRPTAIRVAKSKRPRSPAPTSGPPAWTVAVALALAIGAVYGRALDAPFIFDDSVSITDNVSILRLWPLVGTETHRGPLYPAPDLPTSSRPLVNLSFALNYHFGGLNPVGYHVANVIMHFLSSVLLWGLVRRTLCLPYFFGRFDNSAGWLALGIALLWALHPLQTESVIYITQRTELMVALFYLATLYCSLRYWSVLLLPSAESWDEGEKAKAIRPQLATASRLRRPVLSGTERVMRGVWLTLAILACLCGMASKEVMVSAPLMVLLFERTFVAGSLAKALRRSWPLYVGLAATWLALLGLMFSSSRSGSAGFGLGVPAVSWWLVQTKVLLMYLKLVIWPWPLLIHYQLPYFEAFSDAWMYAIPVLLLAAVTLVLLWRNRPVGYLLTFVFAVLSPTLVVPIITEMAAERRMYLPLAALIVLFVLWALRLAETLSRRWNRTSEVHGHSRLPSVLTGVAVLALALVFGVFSANHLSAYYDEAGLWRDVLRHQPASFKAHDCLGFFLYNSGRVGESIDEFRAALSIRPDFEGAQCHLGLALSEIGQFAEAIQLFHDAVESSDTAATHFNLGHALAKAGRLPEAIEELKAALDRDPNCWAALNDYGLVSSQTGHLPEAIKLLQHAVQIQPNKAEIHNNLGRALSKSGRISEAIDEFNAALALKPDDHVVLNNLAIALLQIGRHDEAIEHVQHALKAQPDHAEFHNTLAIVLARSGRATEAIEELRTSLRLKPDVPATLNTLGMFLAQAGRFIEAIEPLERAVKVAPAYVEAHVNLGIVLRLAGKVPQAIEQLQLALELNSNEASAHFHLGCLLSDTGKLDEAITHFEQVNRLQPNHAEAQFRLAEILDRTGKTKDAIEHYRAALRIKPDDATAYLHLAKTLARLEQSQEAIATAQQGIDTARRAGQEMAATPIEEWLANYQAELRRSGSAAPPSPTRPQTP
jgi:protein O-mannosyl-transferase